MVFMRSLILHPPMGPHPEVEAVSLSVLEAGTYCCNYPFLDKTRLASNISNIQYFGYWLYLIYTWIHGIRKGWKQMSCIRLPCHCLVIATWVALCPPIAVECCWAHSAHSAQLQSCFVPRSVVLSLGAKELSFRNHRKKTIGVIWRD